MRRTLALIATGCAILGAALVLPLAADAHEVRVTVSCEPGVGIQVHGVLFTGNPAGSEPLHSPVTVTGPGGYVEVFAVTTAEWAHTFPLGPNGSYHIDWPEAGPFAQDFAVDCAEPSPTRTPPTTGGIPPPSPVTPEVTLPPTDTAP